MMATSTMCVRMDEEEKRFVTDYAKTVGCSVSDLVRNALFEYIEDRIDYRAAVAAKREFDANPVTYSTAEVLEVLR